MRFLRIKEGVIVFADHAFPAQKLRQGGAGTTAVVQSSHAGPKPGQGGSNDLPEKADIARLLDAVFMGAVIGLLLLGSESAVRIGKDKPADGAEEVAAVVLSLDRLFWLLIGTEWAAEGVGLWFCSCSGHGGGILAYTSGQRKSHSLNSGSIDPFLRFHELRPSS